MASHKKVTKYRRPIKINVGFIIFLIIFFYVIISVCVYFTKDHLSIYEVKKGYTADDYTFHGLIFREEKIITTNTAGYINYYHKDGDRVAKNSIIYMVNENRESYDLVSSDENIKISDEESASIKGDILDFHKKYENGDFSNIYSLKSELQNSALQVVSDSKLSNLNELLGNKATSKNINVARTSSSGIITYSIDNYENLTIDAATSKDFNSDSYEKIQLRSSELVEKNSPIYKIITSDKWDILILLDKKQYENLAEKEQVTVTFTEDELKVTAPIKVFEKGNDYFAKITMDKYMVKYLDKRFITIEIKMDAAEGLKIPTSSITEKIFYQIPKEYFTTGGNSDSTGLVKEVKELKDGELNVIYSFIPTDIYYSDDDYNYVDGLLFEPGDIIQAEGSGKRYEIGDTKKLKGVFNINKGYAVFRRIEILYENDEYCIVKEGTPYGISIYDHIALDAKTATEQALIY